MAAENPSEVYIVDYPGFGEFKTCGGSDLLKFRAQSFLTKEPTTLEWLKSLEPDSLLIDIGANIGIYSIPASLFHVKKVIAVEPEIKNYNMLLQNLAINQISSEKCEAIPVAVSTKFKNKYTKLYLTQDVVGASCHQIGANQDFKLRPFPEDTNRKYRNVFCVSLAQIVEQASEDHSGPIHIKIDVDGIEADVCESLFKDGLTSKISSFQIELNDSINEHHDLIVTLQCLGFHYDPRQVEKACRKEGAFKGYAEYVFRRCLPDVVISKLPNSISLRMGSQLLTTPDEDNHKPCDYFSKSQPKIVQTSRLPAAFIVKKLFDYVQCSDLFHRLSIEALSQAQGSFHLDSLKAGKQKQSLRYQIKAKMIKELAPEYLLDLKSMISREDIFADILRASSCGVSMTHHRNNLSSSGHAIENGMRLIGRARHFVDLCGYSLCRHHDSEDTLCALIAPIFPYSTSTSIVDGGPVNRSYRNNLQRENLTDDPFQNDVFYYSTPEYPKTLSYFREKNLPQSNQLSDVNRFISEASAPYSFTPVDLAPGEALLIPNVMCSLFFDWDAKSPHSKAVKWLLRNCGHGILPGVHDVYRPVLLVDYMIVPEKDCEIAEKSSDVFVDFGDANLYLDKILKYSLNYI